MKENLLHLILICGIRVFLLRYVSFFIFINDLKLVCTCFAGLMSGLTVGILSIDMLDLELKMAIGSEEEIKNVSNKNNTYKLLGQNC